VDETSQDPAEGKCLAFGSEKGIDYVITDAGPIYQGVRFVRTTAMLTPDLVLFVDQIHAEAPRTLDILYHQVGIWEALPAGQAWTPPAVPGYQYLTGATLRHSGAEAISLRTRVRDEWHPTVTLAASDTPTEIITGYGIRKTTEDRVPMLLMRRTAQRTAFVWAVSLDGTPVTLHVSPVTDTKAPGGERVTLDEAVQVQVTQGQRQWFLLVNPQKRSVAGAVADGGVWRSEAAFTVR
jgi:hypothetical protein